MLSPKDLHVLQIGGIFASDRLDQLSGQPYQLAVETRACVLGRCEDENRTCFMAYPSEELAKAALQKLNGLEYQSLSGSVPRTTRWKAGYAFTADWWFTDETTVYNSQDPTNRVLLSYSTNDGKTYATLEEGAPSGPATGALSSEQAPGTVKVGGQLGGGGAAGAHPNGSIQAHVRCNNDKPPSPTAQHAAQSPPPPRPHPEENDETRRGRRDRPDRDKRSASPRPSRSGTHPPPHNRSQPPRDARSPSRSQRRSRSLSRDDSPPHRERRRHRRPRDRDHDRGRDSDRSPYRGRSPAPRHERHRGRERTPARTRSPSRHRSSSPRHERRSGRGRTIARDISCSTDRSPSPRRERRHRRPRSPSRHRSRSRRHERRHRRERSYSSDRSQSPRRRRLRGPGSTDERRQRSPSPRQRSPPRRQLSPRRSPSRGYSDQPQRSRSRPPTPRYSVAPGGGHGESTTLVKVEDGGESGSISGGQHALGPPHNAHSSRWNDQPPSFTSVYGTADRWAPAPAQQQPTAARAGPGPATLARRTRVQEGLDRKHAERIAANPYERVIDSVQPGPVYNAGSFGKVTLSHEFVSRRLLDEASFSASMIVLYTIPRQALPLPPYGDPRLILARATEFLRTGSDEIESITLHPSIKDDHPPTLLNMVIKFYQVGTRRALMLDIQDLYEGLRAWLIRKEAEALGLTV